MGRRGLLSTSMAPLVVVLMVSTPALAYELKGGVGLGGFFLPVLLHASR